MLKYIETRGIWGHAPPENFCNLQPLRLLLVASKTSLTVNVTLNDVRLSKILRTLICKFPQDSTV